MINFVKNLSKIWKNETERRRSVSKERLETEFLPAALEVVETPPPPLGRVILWTIIISVIIALAWSFFSRVSEVAVAEGRLIPVGRLRSVEASEPGVIQSISVHEGQHVNAGDVLITLDHTEGNANVETANVDLITASLVRARDHAILHYVLTGKIEFKPPENASPESILAERELIQARIEEYNAKVLSLKHRRAGAIASAASISAEISKLQNTIPILGEQYQSQQNLAARGFGARQKLLQAQQSLISAQGDLASQRARFAEAKAQMSSIDADIAQARGEFLGRSAQEATEAESGVAQKTQILTKEAEKRERLTLRAPVSGTIQEVTITTIGQTPEVGKPLVTMVPDGEELVAEGLLLNRDAGFVHPGQEVIIKLEAYPFTRYGVLHGYVDRVSPDATVDEHRGLVYPISIKLKEKYLIIDGKPAILTAGMQTTLEVVVGKRRVIDYLLSPIAKAVREAGRER